MASQSSGSTTPAVLIDDEAEAGEVRPAATGRDDLLVVAGSRCPVAADYAAFVRRAARSEVTMVADGGASALAGDRDGAGPGSLVLFLPPSLTEADRRGLDDLLRAASRRPIRFVGVVSSFRAHLDDRAAVEGERLALELVRSHGVSGHVAVLRPGLVLSPNSGVGRWLERLGPLFPLAPRGLRTCFIEGEEFFAAIESVREDCGTRGGAGDEAPAPLLGRAVGRRGRAYTFLGANLPWRDLMERRRGSTPVRRAATATASVLAWLPARPLVALVVALLARTSSPARAWSVRTLEPRSMGELLSLCHRGNVGRVRVVGYNNGVNHFGHRHPEKTIVSTVRCRRTAHAGPGMLKVDCGATIRDARDCLAARGEELFVVPNYSYVTVGTAFFVPIHGSAVDYSTVADTADRVVLYDPDRDRIVSAARHEAAFGEHLYNPRSRAVLLRLYLRTKPKSGYFVRSEAREDARAGALLEALRDRDAANVEIRQGHAASRRVTVSKYYTSAGGPAGAALESPRDALGRLWDRLEENPITSFLMHALSRHLAWHTELFMTPAEFERFWATHAEVALRKIQLRYIRRDGMPHSPFRDEDCVSADLFLFRPDKPAFDAYMRRTLADVRYNPGKHSN